MDGEREKTIKLLVWSAIIFIIIIFAAVVYNIFIKDDGAKTSDKYILFGNYLILQKTNFSYQQIKTLDDKILQYDYIVTDGKNTRNDVKIQFLNNKWYLFDKEYNEIKMNTMRMATHNFKATLVNYLRNTHIMASDDQRIHEFLENDSARKPDSYFFTKISTDLDNDGQEENLYTLNNNSLAAVNYPVKGFLLMEKDSNLIKIAEAENQPFTIMEIVDLESDGTYEMIVNKGDVDLKSFDSCYQIYSFKDGKFELVKDCK